MRPMRIVLALAALLLLLAPGAAVAGNGGGGGGGGGGSIDGLFYYADKSSFDKIVSVANIQQPFDFCFAMRIVETAVNTTTNRRVQIEARSLGSIGSQNSSKVRGDFGAVQLDLTIRRGPTTNATTSPVLFTGSAISFCSLDAQVFKGGEMDKAALWCDLGPEFAAFDIPDFTPDPFAVLPDISRQELLDTIAFALGKKKDYKLDTSKGIFAVKHLGTEISVPDEFMTSLTCDIIDDD